MSAPEFKKRNVRDQQDALSAYFEALLSEVEFGEAETLLDNTPLLDEIPQQDHPAVAHETDMQAPVQPDYSRQKSSFIAPPVIQEEEKSTSAASQFAEATPHTLPSSLSPSASPSLPLFINPPVFIAQSDVTDMSAETAEGIRPTPETDTSSDQLSQTADDMSSGMEEYDSAATSRAMPEWAQSRFQCLMFSVAGLKIAAPLEKLNGIIEWPARITLIPGRAPWFLGLYRNRDTNVQIMDLARILQLDHAAEATASARAKYIMLIDEGRIGLASDSVANMLTLEPEAVKWNAITPTTRRIVAGTVVEQMCAVLDIEALISHINRS